MVVYISESLGSKKNGGSSLSGYEFLQLLRIKYKDIVVLTHDDLKIEDVNHDNEFYGKSLNSIRKVIIPKKVYTLGKVSLRRILIKVFYFFKYLFRRNVISLDEIKDSGQNILFVNSWSTIFKYNISDYDDFKLVCIVRGSPESFIWQSHESDKEALLLKEAAYLDQFNSLIYVSKNGIGSWKEYKSVETNNYYLPNSINEIDLEDERMKFDQGDYDQLFDPENFNVTVVGSIQTRKAQDILLSLFPEILESIPNLKIHLIGNISELWGGPKIIGEITKFQFSEYFKIHGHSNNVFKYMFPADLLLFTSRAEAFPRTVAEYMAVGKPIIAADVSGVNEMIKDGYNGFLYNPHEEDALMNAFRKFFEAENKGAVLAQNAKETYFSVFSKSEHIKKAIKLFENL